MRSTMHAVRVTGTALAFALCVPAYAGQFDAFLKFPPIEGESAKDDHKNEIEILSWSWGETRGANAAKVSKVDALTIKQGAAASGEKGGTEDINIGVGELQEARSAPANDRLQTAGPVNAAAAPAQSGLPTGKRQHKPMTITKPLEKGSAMLKLKSAWADCRVGTRYPSLELGSQGQTYKLTDAVVTSCSGSGGDRPMESISLNYTKIEY